VSPIPSIKSAVCYTTNNRYISSSSSVSSSSDISSSGASATSSFNSSVGKMNGIIESKEDNLGMELFYFALRGRAEQIRLLMCQARLDYTDRLLTQVQLRKLKAPGSPVSNPNFLNGVESSPLPFGNLPLLKDGDFYLGQSGAILQYVAMKGGLYPIHDPILASQAHMIVAGCEDLFQSYWPIKLDMNRYMFHSGTWPLNPGVHDDYTVYPAAYLPAPFDHYTVPRGFRRETLPRWLTYFERLLRANTRKYSSLPLSSLAPSELYFVGSKLSYADICVFAHIDAILTIEPKCLLPFSFLQAHYNFISNLPHIKQYLQTRPISGL